MRRFFSRTFVNAVGDNPWYLCVEVFWAAVYASAQTFAGAYAIRLGATNSQVSLLSSIPALTAAIILLPAGHFLQHRERRKHWLLSSLLLARAGTLLYVLIPWIHLDGLSHGALFVAFFAVVTLPTHFFNLGFIPFLAQAVPEPHRADTFSARNILIGAMLSLSNFLLGIWLARVAFPYNYQAMFLFAFALSMVSLYYLSKVHVSEAAPNTLTHEAARNGRSFTKQWLAFFTAPWRVQEFTQIVINTFLYGMGLWAAAPLLLLYFLRTLGATESWLGVLGSVGSLTTIFGYILWRWTLTRWGETKILKWTIVAMGLYPLLAGLIPSLTAILFAAGLNGVIAAGVTLTHFNTFLKVIPEGERHNYTALYLTLMNIGAFVCPLIGIVLAEQYGFAPVLIACGLLSIVGSTSFWIWPIGESRLPAAASMPEGG